ncbi:MAG TPA: hypothetical protein PLM16_02265 [Candidatus Woesebacteria bacterium]|nr:hypothetical protein [Candidatus Woesebacteria bacterium]
MNKADSSAVFVSATINTIMTERKTIESKGFTLSDATATGRKGLIVLFVSTVLYLVLRMLFHAAVNYYRAMNPPPPPPPTVGFGVLPVLDFPEVESKRPIEYILETANNRLPEFSDRANVYMMMFRGPSLLADEQVRQLANQYGFSSQPEMLDQNTYRWSKYQPLESILEADLVTKNFSIYSDFKTRPELISASNLPDKYSAIQAVKTYLRKSDSLPPDVATASGNVSYLRVMAGEVLPAVSLSDANFIHVTLDRVPLEENMVSYNPDGSEGLISAIVSNSSNMDEQVVELHYRYQPINKEVIHTYPLKPVAQAWQELQTGEGFLVAGFQDSTALVREVNLGYYESFQDQAYFQPIYIFKGDNNFMAYIQAVESRYIAQ